MVAGRLRRAESAAPLPHPFNYPPRMGLSGGEGLCVSPPSSPRRLSAAHSLGAAAAHLGTPLGISLCPQSGRGEPGAGPVLQPGSPARLCLRSFEFISPHPPRLQPPLALRFPAAPWPFCSAPRPGTARPGPARTAVQMLNVPVAPWARLGPPEAVGQSLGIGYPRAATVAPVVGVPSTAGPSRAVPPAPRSQAAAPRLLRLDSRSELEAGRGHSRYRLRFSPPLPLFLSSSSSVHILHSLQHLP